MAYKIDTHITKALQIRTENVVTDVKSNQTALMDLSSFVVELAEDRAVKYVQLLDRTVHDMTVIGPEIIPEDPYAEPTKKGSVHLFFPPPLADDTDGS